MFLFQIAGIALVALVPETELFNIEAAVLGVSQFFFILLPALWAVKRTPLPISGFFPPMSVQSAVGVLAFIAALASFQVFASGWAALQESLMPDNLREIFQTLQKEIEAMYLSLLKGDGLNLYLAIAAGAVAPAICEEFLFRGFLFASLLKRMTPAAAIAVSGIFFGLIHFNPIDVVALVGIGFLLGTAAYASGGLILPMALHFFNNLFGVIIINSVEFTQFEDEVSAIPAEAAAGLALGGFVLTVAFSYAGWKSYKDAYLRGDSADF